MRSVLGVSVQYVQEFCCRSAELHAWRWYVSVSLRQAAGVHANGMIFSSPSYECVLRILVFHRLKMMNKQLMDVMCAEICIRG